MGQSRRSLRSNRMSDPCGAAPRWRGFPKVGGALRTAIRRRPTWSPLRTAPPTLNYVRMKPLTRPKEGKAGIAPGLVHVSVPTALANAASPSSSPTLKLPVARRLAN
jgi:hypothetical protein